MSEICSFSWLHCSGFKEIPKRFKNQKLKSVFKLSWKFVLSTKMVLSKFPFWMAQWYNIEIKSLYLLIIDSSQLSKQIDLLPSCTSNTVSCIMAIILVENKWWFEEVSRKCLQTSRVRGQADLVRNTPFPHLVSSNICSKFPKELNMNDCLEFF